MANADVFAKMRPPTREKLSAMTPGTKNEPMVSRPEVEDQKVEPYTAAELEVEGMDPTTPRKIGNPIRVKGSGGYVYDVMPDNTIRIIQSTRGKGGQIVTEDSRFYDLIMDDIKKMNPEGSASPEGDTKVMDLGTTYIPAPKSSGTPAREIDLGPTAILPPSAEALRSIPSDAMTANPRYRQSMVFASMVKLGADRAVAAKAVRSMDKTSLDNSMAELAKKGQLVPPTTATEGQYEDALLNL